MNLQKKLVGDEEERAVSPVIGVILMVAITVILAAVIAAFVLDLGQSQSANVNAGVSIDNTSDEVSIQLTDSGNAERVDVQVSNSSGWVFNGDGECDGSISGSPHGTVCQLEDIGDTATYTGSGNTSTMIAVDGDNSNVINNAD